MKIIWSKNNENRVSDLWVNYENEAAVLIVPNTDDSWKRAPRVVVLFFIFFWATVVVLLVNAQSASQYFEF